MPLTLVTGPANSAKARAVLDGYRAARARAPMLVVPTLADVEHYRRELAEEGSVLGVRVERFAGLVNEIARRVELGGRPLGALARQRLATVAIERANLRLLEASARSPGFAAAVVALVAELEAERVTPQRLAVALRAWAGADTRRGAYGDDTCAIYAAYLRELERLGRRDAEQHAGAALDALRLAPSRWRATPVFFYGFDDFTALELDTIDTLAKGVDAPVTVSLNYEPGRVAFAGRAATFQTLAPLADDQLALDARADHYAAASRAALHHLERGLFEAAPGRATAGDAVRLLEAGGERAELELVAAEVLELLRDGIVAEEIAVVLRSPADAAPLVDDVFGAFAIPYALERPLRLEHTALGRGLLALLRSALLDGTADDLLAWLRTPGVLRRPELADRLEADVRRSGLDGAAARARWEREHWPLAACARLQRAHAAGPAALLRRVRAELAGLLAAPARRGAPRFDGHARDDARAFAHVARTLDELLDLAELDARLAPQPAALIAALEALELIAGEPPGPGVVAVVNPLALRARRVRALLVCGLQDGVFPAPPRRQAFFGEADRGEIARASGLLLGGREDQLDAERYLFYATVSRPQERLVLSWRTADDEGAPRLPSLFVADVCDLFDAALGEARRTRRLGAVGWPAGRAPSAAEEARGRALAGPRARPAPIAPLRDEAVLADLRPPRVWSASQLERWASCPVKWFVERLLDARDLEPDAEALVRGGFVHAVLEATLRALADETGSARLEPARLGDARRLLGTELERLAHEYPLSPNPERRRAALRRVQADLERYLEHASTSGTRFEPRELELDFGFDEDGPAPLELGDGEVLLRGRIDRIDVEPGGDAAIVYDYKGKAASEGAKWLSERRLQLPLYMLAARRLLGLRPVGGLYQPIGASDQRGRGVVAHGADPELDPVATDLRDQGQIDALLEEAAAQAVAAAREAAAGALEPRPATCAYRGGCEYPGICRCEYR